MKIKRKAKFALLSLIAAPAFSSCSSGAADYGEIGQWVANLVQNNHYSKTDFEDEVSQKLLDTYIDFLDSNRLYFTQVDIDRFQRAYSTSLDDYVFDGSLEPARDIYETYSKRVEARVAKIEKTLAEHEFTFDGDGTVEKRRKESAWPADEAAADALWLKILEGQLLEEELRLVAQRERAAELGKELTEILGQDGVETPKDKVLKRYSRFQRSLSENDEEEVANFFLSALTMVYDPHSEYFSKSELDNFRTGMDNSLVGIGALLSMEDGTAKIQGLVVGGPAHKGGELQNNDRIIGVQQGEDSEMVDIMYMKLNKVVEMIRGKVGTEVILKVIPADAPDDSVTREISIIREKVDLKENLANAELIEIKKPGGAGSTRIGWINLNSFYADMETGKTACSRDVRRLLDRLVGQDIEGLVVDLRGNGGGSLDEAINMTGLFINEGPVVQAKDSKNRITDRSSRKRWAVYDGPLVVLTDRISASASEIFAAALQDYGRAVIVGDASTFGKGTVQTVMPVAQFMPSILDLETRARAGALKVTIQKFYRIAGGSTQLKGVEPDIVLPSYNDEAEIGERHLDNHLPYDTIPKMDYELFDAVPPLAELSSRSAVRVAASPEFSYIREDNARFKELNDRNAVSLNLEQRLAENKSEKERRRERNTARKERFSAIEESEEGLFRVTRFTLDNVDDDSVPSADNFKTDEDSTMIRAKDKTEELAEKMPDYPHFLEPAKREAINVLSDLIELTKHPVAQGKPNGASPEGS